MGLNKILKASMMHPFRLPNFRAKTAMMPTYKIHHYCNLKQFFTTSNNSLTTSNIICQRHSKTCNKIALIHPSSTNCNRLCNNCSWRQYTTKASPVVAEKDANQTYEKALPFDSMPSPGPLYSIPYVGARFLFKPFSDYGMHETSHIVQGLFEKLGPVFRIRFGPDWFVASESLEDAELVNKMQDEFPFRQPFGILAHASKKMKEPLPYLSTLNGPEWKRIRSPMNARLLRPKVIEYYMDKQSEVAVEFADALYEMQDTTSPLEMQEMFFKFATESIGVIGFNKRMGLFEKGEAGEAGTKLLKNYRVVLDCITDDFFGKVAYKYYDDPFYRRFRAAQSEALKFISSCIKDGAEEIARREREDTLDPDEPNFLLSLLSDTRLSETDVLSMVDTMLLGGSDSTACGLQLLFYNLAKNPDKQSILAEEIHNVLGKNGDVTSSNLNKLVYLKATVKESMRVFSPVPVGVPIPLTENTVISGYQVPKGTAVTVSNRRIYMNPLHYDHPEKFSPERWLRDDHGKRTHDISTLAYIPFGIGPRMCVGRRIALQELYLALAKVVQKYEVGLKPDSAKLRTKYTPFCLPKEPLSYSFKLRK